MQISIAIFSLPQGWKHYNNADLGKHALLANFLLQWETH